MATLCVQRAGLSSMVRFLAFHTKLTVSLELQPFGSTGRLPVQLLVLSSTDVRRVLDPGLGTAGVVT